MKQHHKEKTVEARIKIGAEKSAPFIKRIEEAQTRGEYKCTHPSSRESCGSIVLDYLRDIYGVTANERISEQYNETRYELITTW